MMLHQGSSAEDVEESGKLEKRKRHPKGRLRHPERWFKEGTAKGYTVILAHHMVDGTPCLYQESRLPVPHAIQVTM